MSNKEYLYPKLSYWLKGIFFEIRNQYGPGQKENVYCNLIEEKCKRDKTKYYREYPIQIYSIETGKVVGNYRMDFLLDDKIIVEVKSSQINIHQDEKQLYYYLRNSKYEIGYLVNFSTPKLLIKRIIYSNNRKPFLK